jgi:AAA+ superfamily predicted ATPase
MRWLSALLLFQWVKAEECPNVASFERNSSASGFVQKELTVRPARPTPVLSEIVGLAEAKEVLREAVVLPSSMGPTVTRLFWRSGGRSGILLVGPAGLGKAAAAEAAAAAAGALVLSIPATQVGVSGFCRTALGAVVAERQPVVVIVEALDAAPGAALSLQQCLREAADREETMARLFIVATMSHDVSSLSATAQAPFGYIVRLSLPSEAERKQFLLNLLKGISRVDAQWASGLPEAAVSTLANLTAKYTFAEIELVVRRALIRSINQDGGYDPVALHHFEQILASMPSQAAEAFNETFVVAEAATSTAGASSSLAGEARKTADSSKKKSKEVKDPMDGIFGWCNFWLPEALHLPPVVWAMIIFGILAHFMARSTYQPYGNRKRRGGRSSLFPDLSPGSPNPYGGFGTEGFNDLYSSGAPFANFPPPPGMGRSGDSNPLGGSGSGEGSSTSSSMPTAGDPVTAGPS